MTTLTQHFSLEEMTITQVRGVDNTPSPGAISNLTKTCETLEQVRKLLAAPIIINSGFRCPEVNERVGGTPNSAHLYGWAADFICPSFGTPEMIVTAIAKTASINFDQLINEGAHGSSLGWVHLSVDPRMRREVLVADFSSGRAVYTRDEYLSAAVTRPANQA